MPDSAPVIAAPTARVNVTDPDIDAATAQHQYRCAITRAIQRQFPRAVRVRVNKKHIAWSIDEQRYIYNTPEVAIETVIRPLDTGHRPEPVTLRLTNGYVRPVVHNEQDELDRHRAYDRAHPKSSRPQFEKSFERFTENG